jgi:plasmid stabilization system protein ParE
LNVIYTEEAIADIVEAISYLNEHNPTAAVNLDAEISRCIERLADRAFEGPFSRLRSGALVRSWGVPPFRDLLPAASGRTVDRARVPPGPPTHHAIGSLPSLGVDCSDRCSPLIRARLRKLWIQQNELCDVRVVPPQFDRIWLVDAKRQALDALDVQRGRVLPDAGNGNGGAPEIEAIIEAPESVTSQSRYSLTLSGSPPHGKLLIPFERRDVRVVEGARLESVCRRNPTEGSNPSLSANSQTINLKTYSIHVAIPRVAHRIGGNVVL